MPYQEGAKTCPLCDQELRYTGWALASGTSANVQCERCGHFTISFTASEYIQTEEIKPNRYLLSAACRNWSGAGSPQILTNTVKSLIQQVPRLSVPEMLDKFLLLLAKTTPRLDAASTFNPNTDYPLLAFRDANEAIRCTVWLYHSTFVEEMTADSRIYLTLNGWEHVSQLQKSGPESRFAFVAMWFDPSVDALYKEAIEPAIRDAGYEPLRVDRTEHVNRIDDEIIALIRRSRFMVADFTGQRQGVYFEAGMMMGLSRNVIWMCRKEEIDAKEPHFDVRQYNFIPWEKEALADARKRLSDRIVALEGEGS